MKLKAPGFMIMGISTHEVEPMSMLVCIFIYQYMYIRLKIMTASIWMYSHIYVRSKHDSKLI